MAVAFDRPRATFRFLAILLIALLPAALAAPAITNGSMGEGTDTPAAWDGQNGLMVRDTDDFVTGPASLRLEPADGAVEDGKATQQIRNAAGTTFVISGYVKSTGACPRVRLAYSPEA